MSLFYKKKSQIKLFIILALASFPALPLSAGKPLEISKDFTLFTSRNLQGYVKPLFTTIEESFNSNIYSKAVYDKNWTIALDISAMGMLIPDDQKLYDAQRPEEFGNTGVTKTSEMRYGRIKDDQRNANWQPTIYGGRSTPIFSAPQYHSTYSDYNKTVAYAEGANINMMSGLPIIQLVTGLPTRTQLRFRFLAAPVLDEMLYYYGIMVNQQVNRIFGLFGDDPSMGMAVNLAYHNITRNEGIKINSWAAGLHFSKSWDNGLTAFTGIQLEGMNGEIIAIKKDFRADDIINSPWEEVRDGKPLQLSVETFTTFRFTGGFSFRTGFFEIHGDAAWASQPVLSAGITFWIASFGKSDDDPPGDFEIIQKVDKF
jgi:hypothetical protein